MKNQKLLLTLNPNQIPTIAPAAPKNRDEKERTPAPHNSGMRLPTVDPTNIPSQTKDFEDMFFKRDRYLVGDGSRKTASML